jgi:uncharacterized oxidoreductase
MTRHVSFERLTGFVAALFRAAGSDQQEADTVAFGLAEANLVGHDSHGVLRVPTYLADLDAGIVLRGRRPSLVADNQATLTFDGQAGLGQVAGAIVMAQGIARTRELGTAVVILRNVGHLGRVGRWAEQAAADGLISLHFVNTSGGLEANVMLVAPSAGVTGECQSSDIARRAAFRQAPLIMVPRLRRRRATK